MRIVQAHTPRDLKAARILFHEYERFLGVDLCFQGFEQELATLPGRYALPSGRLLLARVGERAAGVVALRSLEEEGACEIKQLFVRPAYRPASKSGSATPPGATTPLGSGAAPNWRPPSR